MEFQLDTGSETNSFNSLDEFTQGYIEAMFFTETGCFEDENEEASFAELAPETLEEIKRNCTLFQTKHGELLARTYTTGYTVEMAGSDYWYTRNGHGVGYWDRGLGQEGEALTDVSQYNEINLYRGDDGLLYLA